MSIFWYTNRCSIRKIWPCLLHKLNWILCKRRCLHCISNVWSYAWWWKQINICSIWTLCCKTIIKSCNLTSWIFYISKNWWINLVYIILINWIIKWNSCYWYSPHISIIIFKIIFCFIYIICEIWWER
jgi:hypothetical protein